MLVIDSYMWLKIFNFRIGKYQSYSSFNAQLSWRKTFATFSKSFSLEPPRMLTIFVRHSSLIVSSTAFCLINLSHKGLFAIITFFCTSSLLNVVTISVDRFLAVHLHLRYQERVTHKRVIAAVISIWLLSAIISSSVFWNPLFIISQVAGFVNMTVCLILVVIVYWRIYIVIKRHKIQIEGLQIQGVQQGVQNGDLSNFLKLRKSALGTFYVCIVFLICYLPSYILSFLFLARLLSPISFYEALLYTTTLFFLNSSLNPVIYCLKMGAIRRTLIDIMRVIVNRFRE